MTQPTLSLEERAAATRRITQLSVSLAAILSVLKLGAWIASGSTALLASFADSGLDLFASLVTLYAVRYAVAPPDAEHRFGHGKAEAFASLLQAGLVFASAALIAREAIDGLMYPRPLQHEGWAIAVMLISTGLTGYLVTEQSKVLKRTASVAVAGDRAHYASDLISNVVALAGIGLAAWLGVDGMDAAAAVVIAALLLWGAVGVFRQASAQLMDRELSNEARARIVRLVTEDPRLTDVHQLRTRASGPYIHIQLHVDLPAELTLEAAHKVIVAAENRLLTAFPSADILIHADPRGRAEPHGGAFAEANPTR